MTVTLTGYRFRSPLATGALAVMLILTTQIPRAPAGQDPGAFITNVGTQGIQGLRPDVSSSERLARSRQLLQQDFDLSGVGLFSLRRYRLSTTPQEHRNSSGCTRLLLFRRSVVGSISMAGHPFG
jgi:hypothetical protein